LAHEYIDWFEVKDPHPAALPNLQNIVDYMVAEKAVHNTHPLSIYAIAKRMGKQHKQIAQLLRGRPGFVEVHRDGKFQGYYYDYVTFTDKYPSNYRDLKRTRVLLSEDIKETLHDNVQEFNDRMPELAKKFRQEISNVPDLPEFAIPGGGKRARMIVEFSVAEDPQQQILIAFDRLADPRFPENREKNGIKLLSGLLSSRLPKENDNG
jgi:hypothetical protein